jgi:hypothetical protein
MYISWRYYWRPPFPLNPYPEHLSQRLFSSASHRKDLPVPRRTNYSSSGTRVCSFPHRLLQRYLCWSTVLTTRPYAEGDQCCCQTGPSRTSEGTHEAAPETLEMASHSSKNRFQACRSCLPLPLPMWGSSTSCWLPKLFCAPLPFIPSSLPYPRTKPPVCHRPNPDRTTIPDDTSWRPGFLPLMLPRLELPPILSYLLAQHLCFPLSPQDPSVRTKLSKVILLHFFGIVTNSSVIWSNLPICKMRYINLINK